MKWKKIVQIMVLSCALTFSVITQQAQACSAIFLGGGALPISLAIVSGTLGWIFPLSGCCIGACSPSDDAKKFCAAGFGCCFGMNLWTALCTAALDKNRDSEETRTLWLPTFLDTDTAAHYSISDTQRNAYNDAIDVLIPLCENYFFEYESFHPDDLEDPKKCQQALTHLKVFCAQIDAAKIDFKLLEDLSEKTQHPNTARIKIIQHLITEYNIQSSGTQKALYPR